MGTKSPRFDKEFDRLKNFVSDELGLFYDTIIKLEKEVLDLEQQILYVQSGNISLDDLCIDIRRKHKLKKKQKHIER